MDDYYGNTEAEQLDTLGEEVMDLGLEFIKTSSNRHPLTKQPGIRLEETPGGVKLIMEVEYSLKKGGAVDVGKQEVDMQPFANLMNKALAWADEQRDAGVITGSVDILFDNEPDGEVSVTVVGGTEGGDVRQSFKL